MKAKSSLEQYRVYTSHKKGYMKYKDVPVSLAQELMTDEVIMSGYIKKVDYGHRKTDRELNLFSSIVIWLNN